MVTVHNPEHGNPETWPKDDRAFVCQSRVELPAECAVGPLAAMVLDQAGNIYCSDELNHRVMSFGPEGRCRWRVGSSGSDPGRFRYPRGMSLGWLEHAGNRLECIAVCDSWNRRIQFFSLEGDFLALWVRAGGSDFGVVTDIRFVKASAYDPGYWLIADRDNHCLCGADPAGECVFRAGRCLPEELEPKWAAQSVRAHLDSVARGSDPPFFDPLYYPTRILGEAESALYVWGPPGRSLKQFVAGNLFRLPASRYSSPVWICADGEGIVGWDPALRSLVIYRGDAEPERGSISAGWPVPANLGSGEMWIQNGSELWRLAWRRTAGGAPRAPGDPFRFLWDGMGPEITRCRESRALQPEIDAVAHCVLRYHALAESVLSARSEGPRNLRDLARYDTAHLKAPLDRASEALREAAGKRGDLLLALRGLGAAGGAAPQPEREDLSEWCRALHEPLHAAFAALSRAADDIHVWAAALSPWPGSEEDSNAEASTAMFDLASGFYPPLAELAVWIRFLNPLSPSTGAVRDMREQGARIARESVRQRKVASSRGPLHETGRIALKKAAASAPSEVFDLTCTSDGHLYASLTAADCIAHLDQNFRIVEYLTASCGDADALTRPAGIAADLEDRIWIAEFLCHRFRVCGRGAGSVEFFLGGPSSGGPFRFPHGICAGRDGAMYVADTNNNRIIRIGRYGSSVIGAHGTAPGLLRHPVAVTQNPDEPASSIWVVDQRNHRLQNFGPGGDFIGSLGGGGIGSGRLFLPQSAAFQEDQTVIVAQGGAHRALKCLAADGRELWGMTLDYTPGRVMLHRRLLLVTERDGSNIRVYERG
jgi:hypothetical protein